LIKWHNNMSTKEVYVFTLIILDFGYRNLGFEPGTSDLFDRFFRYLFGEKRCGGKTQA
jgi:hypothetical protein